MQVVLICLGIGCVMGVLAGLLGVGGGIVAIPCMMYFFKMDSHEAMGTSLAIIVPLALVAAYKHCALGHVNWQIGVYIAISGVVCAYFGAKLNHYLDPLLLKRIFAIFLIITATQMLLAKKPVQENEKNAEVSVASKA